MWVCGLRSLEFWLRKPESQNEKVHSLENFEFYITVLLIHNITAKAALKFGREAWVLKNREEQRLEAAQIKFLKNLLGITELDKENNQCIKKKQEHRV